jgi:hypothetical protein
MVVKHKKGLENTTVSMKIHPKVGTFILFNQIQPKMLHNS